VRLIRVVALASLIAPSAASAQAPGFTLDLYRAAETPEDGFAIGRPIGLGHLGVGAQLHLDYGLQPLRVPNAVGGADDVLVDHQLTGQLGLAFGVFDRFVGSVRLPVTLLMQGTSAGGDPTPSGAGLGDVALGARWVFVGEDRDEPFALALSAEATIPTAEAANGAQDLAGEAGPSFTPELVVEGRFAPVRITGNLGMRFREPSQYPRVRVANELTWGLGVGVDIVPDLLDATIEGYGTTPLDDFADSRRSPLEVILGARVRPGAGFQIGLAGGLGLGDGYGASAFRGVLTVGWSDRFGEWTPPAHERAQRTDDPREDGPEDEAVASAVGSTGTAPDPVDAAQTPTSGGSNSTPPVVDARYDQLDRDGDRLVDARDRCPLDREDYDEIQDDEGCPEVDADQDQIADVDDMCPLTAGIATGDPSCIGCPERACVSSAGQITISERVEFATGSDRILEQSEAVLGDVLSIVSTNDQLVSIRIEGHTDDRGRDPQNLLLSLQRAASVRRWLVEHGVAPERFDPWGCGELHPLVPNTDRAGRQSNRRVEFFIVDPPTAGYTPREGCAHADEEAPATGSS
jgi:outer membrane protein OmpA-like peptidoglycan-associated protein